MPKVRFQDLGYGADVICTSTQRRPAVPVCPQPIQPRVLIYPRRRGALVCSTDKPLEIYADPAGDLCLFYDGVVSLAWVWKIRDKAKEICEGLWKGLIKSSQGEVAVVSTALN